MDERGREALLKYLLRPPIAQERITQGPDGLVRIALKKRFSNETFAVDLDPLSLLTRLCASVPPPRFHTVRCKGGLASASKLRPRILPEPPKVLAPSAESARYLAAIAEPTEAPERTVARGPPYWCSRVLRRRAGDLDAA